MTAPIHCKESNEATQMPKQRVTLRYNMRTHLGHVTFCCTVGDPHVVCLLLCLSTPYQIYVMTPTITMPSSGSN
jgi:hypothetical protein